MSEDTSKPLQATFDVDEYEAEAVEGVGFEPGVRYRFVIEKQPQGRYMQYGAAKGGLYVLSKKCPDDLREQYQKHPDQFEIFTHGEINGIQALVPGADFEKFKPYLSKTINVAWVHTTDSGTKRLIFMQLNASEQISVNEGHPEWESFNVRLARKFGIDIPNPRDKNAPKFNLSFLHPGVAITAEVVMTRRKNQTRDNAEIDISTIEMDDAEEGASQQKIVDDIDPEIRANVIEHADGCKSVADVIKKIKAFLKEEKITDQKVLGQYTTAITKMKDRKEILA
jgi:hypothetical protein